MTQENPTSRVVHEWTREWTKSDYDNHSKELLEIGKEYEDCQREADLNKEGKPRLFASDIYQIRHKGFSKDLSRIYSDVINKNGEWQQYEINSAKLDKYWKWKTFNRTPEEVLADKELHTSRFAEIKKMLEKFGYHKVETVEQAVEIVQNIEQINLQNNSTEKTDDK